jgi:energy-coupling factor transporter ATP-binding protein EcfA2
MSRLPRAKSAVPAERATADETLISWAGKRPPWARDALRRHATSAGYALSAEDKAAITERVRHAAGFELQDIPACEPLAPEHVKATATTETRTLLCSLGPAKHLNRLAADQQMRFALDGLTVIFGDNGSGKSGYARVAKKMCRSLSKDDLLGNVFADGPNAPAEIMVRYQTDNASVTEITWTDGSPTPPPFANIAVFDAANARLYVDRQNRISYLPTEISLLQQHGEHCAEMDGIFKAEIAAVQKRVKVPLPGGYSAGGEIAKLLSRLDPKPTMLPTVDEIKGLAEPQNGDETELQRLQRDLANDPAELARRSRRFKTLLEQYANQFTVAEKALSSQKMTDLEEKYSIARTTAEAAALAATELFASAPLNQGIGSDPWRHMFEYAKAFARVNGASGDKLPDEIGSPCSLCQEPLTEAGAARIKSFNDFVTGEATRAADAARESLDGAIKAIHAAQIPSKSQAELALAEFGAINEARKALASEIAARCDALIKRRNALLAAATDGNFEPITTLDNGVCDKIAADVAALDTEAMAYDQATADDGARASERAKLDKLRDRKKLADELPTVLARLEDLQTIERLKKCSGEVDTAAISRQITSLRRSLVMKGLRQSIENEIKALDLAHIPLEISDRSDEGESLFGVGLKAAAVVANNKVLSEGEQRALALACFFAEAGTSAGKHGVIIDDPVSSLDHGRIRRVAARIVAEAADGRQVVVFTHNILFFNELIEAAARQSPQVPVLRNFISKTESEGFGLVSETEEPWIIQAVNKRVTVLRERLKAYDNVADFENDSWRRTVTDFYTHLRETWERLVEEVLLGKVVERFNSDVRTMSLKGVVVDDEDYKTIYHAMARVSERSGHDMAGGRAVALPRLADMKADLDELDQYRAKAQKRKTDTSKVRQALEEPPKASVA